MQRGVAHRGAAHEHRLQLGHRRELAGAADLDVDAVQARGLLLGRELVRHGPARLAALEAQAALPVEAVELVDHAVDVEGQGVALGLHRAVEGHQLVGTLADAAPIVHRQAPLLQPRDHLAVPRKGGQAHGLAQAVGVEAQRPRGRDGGVELAHRAGGGVARVDIRLFAALTLLRVQALEVIAAHVDLAAHLQHRGQRVGRALQPQRDLADGADVLRHVFAGLAVAARGGLYQHAGLVTQVDGQAVELELRGVGHGGCLVGEFELAAHARVEGASALGAGVGLGLDAEHRHRVAHGRQAVEHLADDPLRGRIGAAQRRVRGLQRLQLGEQAVVLGVGDLRRVEHVVAVRMVVQLLAQQRGAVGRGLRRGR